RVFAVDRRDQAAPGSAKLLQQFLGRRAALLDHLVEWREMPALVAAGRIEPVAPAQARMRERDAFARELGYQAPPDLRLEAELRHVVAQLLALFGAPVLDDVPGRIEAGGVVEQPDPERRQRRQAPPRAAVGAAHLEVALEADLGKDRRDVVRPIRDGS